MEVNGLVYMSNMSTVLADMKRVDACLVDARDRLTILRNELENSENWSGFGHDETTAFVTLIEKYADKLCGGTSPITQTMISEMETFHNNITDFESSSQAMKILSKY